MELSPSVDFVVLVTSDFFADDKGVVDHTKTDASRKPTIEQVITMRLRRIDLLISLPSDF
ncbi:hypothetical protein [Glaciimonas soli]|uniref:Uncharacterized protein n=1 Tax=Glaciimonas soli TaxID=2590999 RepID=A0A843Z123_9BURK|nr:hypothetical protein [Glaciimonas soli]MQR02556.1 hypothetical protein [Glaciimonas soli]